MWPRQEEMLWCQKCGARLDVIQTCYGARATCAPCKVRWTTLFSEEGLWLDERFSDIRDNIEAATPSGAPHPGADSAIAEAGTGDIAARTGSGGDGQ